MQRVAAILDEVLRSRPEVLLLQEVTMPMYAEIQRRLLKWKVYKKQEQAEAEKANKSKNNNLTSLKAPQQQWLADYLKKMNGDMLSKENGRAQEAKPMGLDPANALNQISLLNSMNGGLPQNKPLNLPLEQTGQSASQNQAQMKVPVSYNLLLKLFQNAVQGNNKDDKK